MIFIFGEQNRLYDRRLVAAVTSIEAAQAVRRLFWPDIPATHSNYSQLPEFRIPSVDHVVGCREFDQRSELWRQLRGPDDE